METSGRRDCPARAQTPPDLLNLDQWLWPGLLLSPGDGGSCLRQQLPSPPWLWASTLGLLNTFDSVIREWMRPDDVWGTAQVRADYVVEGLRPAVVVSILAAYTAVICVIRRSLRPGLFVGAVWLITAALTVAVKIAMGRPDPHGVVGGHGGSFPSGHTISVVVCLGLAVLVAQPRLGRWIWIPLALVGALMGAALLVQAAHWSTDVLGGGLLAIGVLTAASVSGWRRWSQGPTEDRQVAD